MLLQHFYTIVASQSIEPQSFETTVTIQKEHPVFEGHFPNFPVTPGVAMLQIIKELTENHLQQSLFLKSASNVKFLAVVDPNVNASLKFNIAIQEDGQHIKIKNNTSFKDGTPVLKCNVTFVKR
ncbi:3-hydroxyacyl-ACP dehydratase [Gelidibacter salicanalis]|uniref:3-hydroxyacyl-ACP dehydratase n=1 Tax=Gelidibacter salicanalis TaxID=291193 RepID=A0A934KRX6_9FLAO|nr:3-hydroxyacyl-ACP dehydratase [Gelidibacter salicanalis]MBJ7879558.1 3-hydroxyacyl-ACP dehydratase [Gelidibacter salicanalis]